MEDNIHFLKIGEGIIFYKLKTTSFSPQMEDDLNMHVSGGHPQNLKKKKLCNIKQTKNDFMQFLKEQHTTNTSRQLDQHNIQKFICTLKRI